MFGTIKKLFTSSDHAQLREIVNNPKTFLVDVRTSAEFAAGSVKGAINVPLDRLPAQLAMFKGKENIVVFCRSGNRSRQAKYVLEQNGFTSVINGGAWLKVRRLKNK